jgi:geranylgeranyl diphosphate synthase type I
MPDLGAEFNSARRRKLVRKALELALADPLLDLDDSLDLDIQRAFASAEAAQLPFGAADLPLFQLLRYHLGYLDESLRPARADAGKRIRPRLCLLACRAACGDVAHAVPVATAIELLHNFTLIHDDIQDASPLRRHRPTVWALWGVAQAVNAGDALFALAHIALNRLAELPIPAAATVELSTALHLTTLRIVEGQTLDLGFEERDDVSADEYLRMIGGKTAAICAYACWAGARVAGADARRAAAFGSFGEALGVGFQLRDDLLGVWGATSATGKAAADDIRRRKKSLPILLLREHATPADRARIAELYAQAELPEVAVSEVLELLTRYEIGELAQAEVERWHDRAELLLADAAPDGPAREPLTALVNQLARRPG